MLLGCIGDDFTGSSDLANTLAKGGMKTVQYPGVPSSPATPDVQAGVVALKSRSIAANDAVAMSLDALAWLQEQGCEQFFFKYCSTFDSTPHGNIGPVAEALADALNARNVVFCPAFPGTGRSVYQGHLFVKDSLLNESGMQDHPLTPMTDPDLRRVLAAQTQHSVGHVPAQDVLAGDKQILATLAREDLAGHRFIVVDAIRDEDLYAIGKALKGVPLVTGGSGVALGLPSNFGCRSADVPWTAQPGKTIALSGSCSIATRRQVAFHAKTNPVHEISADDVINNFQSAKEVASWMLQQDGIPLVYSSAEPETVRAIQQQFGRELASGALEAYFAQIAKLAVAGGATRVITAGGETSSAIVEGLNLLSLAIGPEIDPGVPALRASDNLVLTLKSGNFGTDDFFEKADQVLRG